MSTEPKTFDEWWPAHFRDHSGMSQGVLARAAWEQAIKSAEAEPREMHPILLPFDELSPEVEALLANLRRFLSKAYAKKDA